MGKGAEMTQWPHPRGSMADLTHWVRREQNTGGRGGTESPQGKPKPGRKWRVYHLFLKNYFVLIDLKGKER